MSESIREILDELGYFSVPDDSKKLAEIGVNLIQEWYDILPEEMRIPSACICAVQAFLADDKGLNVEKKIECLIILVHSVFNMGYTMGQHGLRDPYHNPFKKKKNYDTQAN